MLHQQPSWHALCTAVRDAPVGIGVCDEDGRMLAVSSSLAKLLRRRSADILGRPFLAFVHPEDRPISLAAYFEAVVASAAGVRAGRTHLRCLTGENDPVTVEVAWTVTEGDDFTSPCGILYLTATAGAPAPTAAHGRGECRPISARADNAPAEPA